jgi:hypothetical protein
MNTVGVRQTVVQFIFSSPDFRKRKLSGCGHHLGSRHAEHATKGVRETAPTGSSGRRQHYHPAAEADRIEGVGTGPEHAEGDGIEGYNAHYNWADTAEVRPDRPVK